MKKLLVLTVAMVFATFGAGLALAGEYHQAGTLNCADCHTMHFSQTHQYDGTAGAGVPALGGAGPYGNLLRNDGATLCLACHDGVAGTPDVLEADTATVTGSGGRQAGALSNATATSGDYAVWKGHTLTTSSVTPPGGSAMTGGLSCANCHAVHGSSSYRNLNTTVTYSFATTANNSADVRINLAAYPGAGSGKSGGYYSRNNIFFNELSATNAPYGDFCAQCHGDFHGTANTGAAADFTRHPTEAVQLGTIGTATTGRYTTRTNKVQVMKASNSAAVTDWTDANPSCMSCHKAHGNNNPFGLIYMTGTGTIDEQGDGGTAQRDLCGQCHTQGG